MTKVLMSVDLLAYRQEMKDALRQVVQYNYIGGVRQAEQVPWVELPLARKDLLPSPDILLITLDAYEGQDPEQDFIAAEVCNHFGIASVHITIWDDQGNRIEGGEMSPFPNSSAFWEYLPTVCVPLGTDVIAQVTAMDCMGAIATRWIGKTMGEEW
jgi:hypothetical protein